MTDQHDQTPAGTGARPVPSPATGAAPGPGAGGPAPRAEDSVRQPVPRAGDTVRQIAVLARLDLKGDEAAAFEKQFDRILSHFKVLESLDVAGVEPMLGGSDGATVLRDDTPTPSLAPDRILANAPARVDDFYRVPKTVGGDE